MNCTYSKSPNGFYHWNCSRRTCKECKDIKTAQLKYLTSKEKVSVDQFQTVEKKYLKFNKQTKITYKNSRTYWLRFHTGNRTGAVCKIGKYEKEISSSLVSCMQWQISLIYHFIYRRKVWASFLLWLLGKHITNAQRRSNVSSFKQGYFLPALHCRTCRQLENSKPEATLSIYLSFLGWHEAWNWFHVCGFW